MPRTSALLILGLACGPASAAAAQSEARLLFTGDILLGRVVALEIGRTGRSPWEGLRPLFRQADLVVGNLESAVGRPEDCPRSDPPCLTASPALLSLLKPAGFGVLGLANNHAGDLGPEGIEAARRALREAGLAPLGWEDSPLLLRAGPITVAIVALNLAAGAGSPAIPVPSPELRRKLRLARRAADLVVAFVHWGQEYLGWPSRAQREGAAWLIRQGADAVIGHHPHVVQQPECVLGKPVFYSLGNHVFDQKYPDTKAGLIAELRVRGRLLRAGAIATRTPLRSSFPRLAEGGRAAAVPCAVELAEPLRAGGFQVRGESSQRGVILEARQGERVAWRTWPLPLEGIAAARLAGPEGPEFLLTLERHPSPMDGESGLRPYVYQLGPRGLIPRWRGSALAWPLVDADAPEGETLCALHRADSFLTLDPSAPATRVAAYRWNGFGFSGLQDARALARCAALFP